MKNQCLFCYLPLNEHDLDFHPHCSMKMFGTQLAPMLPYNEFNIEDLALQVLKTQSTITGVQPKLSLHLDSATSTGHPKRFTIVGMWGGFILKPPSPHYEHLPEVEDLTMHLAEIAKIKVVPHCLIRLQSGNLAYITRRIDRVKKTKLHMEEMCQLTERLSEDKYHGSYEQIAKTILKYSANSGLDVVNFFELVLFSFLTGNGDMHLKNFSLFNHPKTGHVLSPAYDLVATTLVNPSDDEDMALTLNGKKKKITRKDFVAAFNTLKLDIKQQENIFRKMGKAQSSWKKMIEISFLKEEWKEKYISLIGERVVRIK